MKPHIEQKTNSSLPPTKPNKFKSMDQLRRSSSTLFSRHRRQNSTNNELSQIVENKTLNDLNRKTRSPERKTESIKDIDESPSGIKNVPNFESPTHISFTSPARRNYSDLSPSRSPSMSPTRPPTKPASSSNSNRFGNFLSVSPPANTLTQKRQSFTLRLKRKISSFMDSEKPTLNEAIESITVPQLKSKSRSNSKTDSLVSPLSPEQDDQSTTEGSSMATFNSKKDVNRRRSRTLGSLEGDLYNKRNGSLVKTISSMVLLKSTAPSPSNSDEESISRPPSPPRVSDDDTVDTYIEKLINEGFEFEATSILSEKNTQFHKDCLYKFISNRFDFTGESLDISLRRLLAYCELPREAQHIDRFVESFGTFYYSCNQDLWSNADQVYFLTFSFVMLHTDYFNLDNKKRMTKEEFIKNTRIDDPESNINNANIPREILEYYFDNITYSKFSNVLHQTQPSRPGSIYMLPKRIFSNSNSYLLESPTATSTTSIAYALAMSSTVTIHQPSTAPQTYQPSSSPGQHQPRSLSISSSTSQFFNLTSSSMIDPYYYIQSNCIDSLSLQLDNVNFENPFRNKLTNAFPESEFSKYYNILKKSRDGAFIRFNKSLNWINTNTEIKRLEVEDEDFAKTNHYLSTKSLLKIIKVHELYREEANSKFFPSLTSSSKTIWKKYYGILTTCGFFLFEHLSFLNFSERELISNNEPIVVEFPDNALKSCFKYSINGLFAVQFEDHDNSDTDQRDPRFTFNIFSTNKRELFSTLSVSEMSSWIISINLIASLDNCCLEFDNYQDHEMVPIRNVLISEKIQKLNKNSKLSIQETEGLLNTVKLLETLSPFSTKTKDSLLQYFKSLNIRIDWLWYEIERNQVYIEILSKFQQFYRTMEPKLNRDSFLWRQIAKSSTIDDENGSTLEDSFINDENGSSFSGSSDDLTHFDDISTVEFLQNSDDNKEKPKEKNEHALERDLDGLNLDTDGEGEYKENEFDNDLEHFVTSREDFHDDVSIQS